MTAVYIFLAIVVLLMSVCIFRAAASKPEFDTSIKPLYSPDERSEKYARILSKMIQCETISVRGEDDREKFNRFHKVLEQMFPNVYAKCELTDIDGNLLFRWKGRESAAPILLMSHQDIVSAEGEWENPPFSGCIDGDVVWGRGTVDTKGSLMCIFQAVDELIQDGYIPNRDVYIATSRTEEISGDGAPKIVNHLKNNGVFLEMLIDEGGMIITEPIGGVRGNYAMIGVVEKGYGDYKFTAKGKGGHASAPEKNTPIPRLAAFINYVEKHDPFKTRFSPAAKEMFKRMAPNMSFGMKVIFANIWLFEPLVCLLMPSISSAGAAMLKTTMAFTKAKGSDGYNVLPQEAYVTANMRFIHHQDEKATYALISDIAKKYDIQTEVLAEQAPRKTVDYNAAAFKTVESTIREIFDNVNVCPYVMTGGTDAGYYDDICDNSIRFAPLYINSQQYDSIHSANENINASVLPKGIDFYKALIKKY